MTLNMKKILYLSNMDIRKRGADKTHFIELGQNLKKAGIKILAVVPGYLPRQKNNYGLDIVFIPTFSKNIFAYLWVEFLKIPYLVLSIIKFKPDIIYARQDFLDFAPPFLAIVFRVPYVTEINGVIESEFKARGVKSAEGVN